MQKLIDFNGISDVDFSQSRIARFSALVITEFLCEKVFFTEEDKPAFCTKNFYLSELGWLKY